MASEEELRRERELNDLFSRRAGINRDIVDDLQDQTNVLNDQIRLLKFEKSERSQIRSLTREVNKIASDNYNITVGELGVQKNLSKIRKDQLQLSKDLNSFTRLRNKLVNDGAKLNSDIVISLDDQIKFTKSLQVELQTVAELSNSIANNETVQRFSKIASFLKLLGPLKGFAAPFEKASEAARASIVANTEILKTGKGLTKEKAKELGIADKLNGIYGKVGLNAAKLTKTQKQQAIQASARKAALKEAYNTSLDSVLIGSKILQSALAVNKAQTQFTQLTGQSIAFQDTFNNGLLTTVDYINQAVSATEQFGLNAAAVFSPDTLRASAEFNALMGFSAEEANSLALASDAFGGNLLDARKEAIEQVKAVNRSNKSVVSTKVALKDAASASKGLTVALGGSVSELTKAAAQARALGLSLSQMEKIADGLLDIETSIKNEFVAETILGRELNLERARFYAQTDQLAKLGKEIAANEGLVEGFIRGGRIERQAAADALNLQVDEMGKFILLNRANLGISTEAALAASNVTETQLKQLEIQEAFNKSVEKVSTLLNRLADFISKGAERGTSKAKLSLNVDGRRLADSQQVPSILGQYRFSS
jgi:hypothetical protein